MMKPLKPVSLSTLVLPRKPAQSSTNIRWDTEASSYPALQVSATCPVCSVPRMSGDTGTLGMEAWQLCLCSFAGPFSRFASMPENFHHSTTDKASTLISTLWQKGWQEINWPPEATNHVNGTAQALPSWRAVHPSSVSHRAWKSSRPKRCLSPLWVNMWGYTFWVRDSHMVHRKYWLHAYMYVRSARYLCAACFCCKKTAYCIQYHCISIKHVHRKGANCFSIHQL